MILLAQNRQADRDRAQAEQDRAVTRTQADTEFLAREMASIRLALADVVTTEDLSVAVARLTAAVERLEERLEPSGDGLAAAESGVGHDGGHGP